MRKGVTKTKTIKVLIKSDIKCAENVRRHTGKETEYRCKVIVGKLDTSKRMKADSTKDLADFGSILTCAVI